MPLLNPPNKPIHPLLHRLRTLPPGVFFRRWTPIRPDPPVGFELFDLVGVEAFVAAVVPGSMQGDGGGMGLAW